MKKTDGFKKIASTKVLDLGDKEGLSLELQEGKNSNVLVLAIRYKDEEGEWQYSSPRVRGAVQIRIPMTKDVIPFLQNSMTTLVKLNAEKPHVGSSEVKVDKLDKETLLKLLAEIDSKESKKSTKPTKKDVAPVVDDTDSLSLEYENFFTLSPEKQIDIIRKLSKKSK